jgi:hypothetical protein
MDRPRDLSRSVERATAFATRRSSTDLPLLHLSDEVANHLVMVVESEAAGFEERKNTPEIALHAARTGGRR